ncbi:MAG: type II toxin-antitoxin system RelE/ParE family toxin [Pseudomonadota bacterium]
MFERIASSNDSRRFGEALKHNFSIFWKYRLGNYRVICDIHEETVTVLVVRIGHQKKVYK